MERQIWLGMVVLHLGQLDVVRNAVAIPESQH
jgi:hypothetical protein